jgi:hypothetical protein
MQLPSRSWQALTKWRWSVPLTLFLGSLLGVTAAIVAIPERIAEPGIFAKNSGNRGELAPAEQPGSAPSAPRTEVAIAATTRVAEAANTPSPSVTSDTPPAYDLPPPPPPPAPASQPPTLHEPVDAAHPFAGVAPRSIRLADSTRDSAPVKP